MFTLMGREGNSSIRMRTIEPSGEERIKGQENEGLFFEGLE